MRTEELRREQRGAGPCEAGEDERHDERRARASRPHEVERRHLPDDDDEDRRGRPDEPSPRSRPDEGFLHLVRYFSRPLTPERARAPQFSDPRHRGLRQPLPERVIPLTRPGERSRGRSGECRGVRVRLLAAAVWVALAAACFALWGLSGDAVVGALGCAVVVAVTVTDLERRIVPNRIVLPALAAALVVQTARDPSVEWVIAALAAGGFFLLFALAYPAGLGMGDVKLAAFLGAWLGRDVAVALVAGTVLGALPALAVLVRQGSAGRTTTFAYVPALAAGAIVGLFFGEAALDAWLG